MLSASTGGPSTESPGATSETRPPSVLSAGLLRCRRWLHLREDAMHSVSGCPERYDATIGLASPTSAAGDIATIPDISAIAETDGTAGMYQPANTPLVQLMNGRWSGCVGPTLSNRSLSSRQGLRARTSAIATARYSRPVTAATQLHAPVTASIASDGAPTVDEIHSEDDASQHTIHRPSGPLSPLSMPSSVPPAEALALETAVSCGSWDCTCCAGADATHVGLSGPGARDSPISVSDRPATPYYERDGDEPLGVRRNSLGSEPDFELGSHLQESQHHYHTFNEEYMPDDSAFAEYASDSYGSDGDHNFVHVSMATNESAIQLDAAGGMVAHAAAMHEPRVGDMGGFGAGAPNSVGVSNTAAIAQIFLVGQPFRGRAVSRGMSRMRRMSQRVLLAASHGLRAARARLLLSPRPEDNRARSSALLEAFSIESSLAGAIVLLEKSRNTRSPSFRMRADRVHVSQARLLNCIYTLFTGLVPADERQSRHYRFYLPEDDQTELDRGFSESVLFAAQALARGFQIRGTEQQTDALREPACMLCSVWAATRFVIYARGSSLWGRNVSFDEDPDAHPSLPQCDLGALRSVLEDFDEAWVRFERDLCFAYFGLSNAQIAGLMDPADTSDTCHITHEEGFSLLVMLLSETLERCLDQALVSEESVETMDPQLILALPRLAILHALASNDSLCLVESEGKTVFWWFSDYAGICRQVRDVVLDLPPQLYQLLQKMLAAEEADVVLAQFEDEVLLEALQKAEVTTPQIPIKARAETVGDDMSSAKRTAIVDLDSIIDSPRSARSLSIDDCISSFCTPSRFSPYATCIGSTTGTSVTQSRTRTSSIGCLGCKPSSTRIYAAAAATAAAASTTCTDRPYNSTVASTTYPDCACSSAVASMLLDAPPLPLTMPSYALGTASEDTAVDTLSAAAFQIHNAKCPFALTPANLISPSMSLASVRSTSIVAGNTFRSQGLPADIAKISKQQRAKLKTCRAQLRQAFVDVCTVADSLHSGPFARAFRVALEHVFRGNTANDMH
ncbi:hypothetical protein COEREDRAFT_80324 [Coemansia reversa NRRL 1564]|uniref:Uncharacterized protein n=1 Tax=Coemansia reversa (strain ATCC 12441 / NRRL 1564) TaxID=763665 RepID=A0A2G5BF22_COERN|nr:hypothetical protein COEREDRAFT_80324 [Coemansia reversa NRRL 1564]|eukprot:PIA17626.1 hypothetical protein COEREDRAFT_80324 [Coemansia reversa NRRL 1564]